MMECDLALNTIDMKESRDNDTELNDIIYLLMENKQIQFKSQQRDENELTTDEKRDIALDMYNKNKFNFLNRFGRFLDQNSLKHFERFIDNSETGIDIKLSLQSLQRFHSKQMHEIELKNRRYKALQKLIEEKTYFSDTEMMKRNPLLYEQLVGQFLTNDERRERDRIKDNTTLVTMLMETIERDDAMEVRKQQEEAEDDAFEEEDGSSDEDMTNDVDNSVEDFKSQQHIEFSDQPSCSRWGEFADLRDSRINRPDPMMPIKFRSNQPLTVPITASERALLNDEFVSLMHQSFLEGRDKDFDYNLVDNDDTYDNVDMIEHDAEDKYFDAEEPESIDLENSKLEESSEDELDIYMNSLNQHPSVYKLSNDLKKL